MFYQEQACCQYPLRWEGTSVSGPSGGVFCGTSLCSSFTAGTEAVDATACCGAAHCSHQKHACCSVLIFPLVICLHSPPCLSVCSAREGCAPQGPFSPTGVREQVKLAPLQATAKGTAVWALYHQPGWKTALGLNHSHNDQVSQISRCAWN